MTTSCGGPICARGVWLMNGEGRGRELMVGKGRGRGRGVRLYRWWWARGSGQLFGPIPHFLSERTASHFRSRSRLCCRRWMITLCVSDCTLHKRTTLPAASPDKRRKHKRYGALSCGNGEDGIAAVLGGVALIDLFGSSRRRNLLPTHPGTPEPRRRMSLDVLRRISPCHLLRILLFGPIAAPSPHAYQSFLPASTPHSNAPADLSSVTQSRLAPCLSPPARA